MKKFALFLLTGILALSLEAEPLKDDAFYTMKALPGELTATLKTGRDIDFDLEENCTTGYAWSALYDARLCNVEIDHKSAKVTGMTGVPGKAEIEVDSLTDQPFTVTLIYSRSWEKDQPPLHTVVCKFNDPKAVASEKVKKDGKVATDKPGQPRVKRTKLRNDASYTLNAIGNEYTVVLRNRKDIDFEFEESATENKLWKLVSCDTTKVRVEIDHDRADAPGEIDQAEIEIKALTPGESTVTLAYGNNEKTVKILVRTR